MASSSDDLHDSLNMYKVILQVFVWADSNKCMRIKDLFAKKWISQRYIFK